MLKLFMEQALFNKKILEKLEKISADVEMLKERIVDPDSALTVEEEKVVEGAIEAYKKGETTSLEDFEKELNVIDAQS